LAAKSAYAQHACPAIEPPPTLVLEKMYSDAKSSVIDDANETANAKIMAPITTFFQTLNRAIDDPKAHPGNSESDCAFQIFGQWAKAQALTFEPVTYDSGGKVKRGLLNPAFQVLGLKFRAAGYALDPAMLKWLQKMNEENVAFYTNGSNRANQRVWAATGAALNNLLERDPAALSFQDQVWHEALAAIHDNGFIDGELERGQQALVYHMYSLSATLILEAARAALGYVETPAEKERVKRLEDGIARTLCNPADMEKLAKAKMRIPGEWAYEVINGFADARLSADWSRCGLPATDFEARDTGGDTHRTAAILASLSRKASSQARPHGG
jgi:poly(beta-D-mannuronate) lyase